jgi:GH15 family glucan-1,4-alpha-glucosidase
VVLSGAEEPLPAAEALRLLDATLMHWGAIAARMRTGAVAEGLLGRVLGPAAAEDAVVRAGLVICGLRQRGAGHGIVAAPTTSLPQWHGSSRTWDYRYSWPRDTALAGLALLRLGLVDEASALGDFCGEACRGGEAPALLRVDGTAPPPETTLDHLAGHGGARPVRIGNGAYNQVQHDIWGTMLDSVYLHAKSREQISDTLWPVLKQQVEEAIKHWKEPDRGIWEVRGEPQHFTSSKIMCWVALDRGSKLAELQGEKSYAQQWRAIAEEIKADILARGVDSRGRLTQRYDHDALDASLLLAVLTRFLPADDPRVRATVLAIADELTEDGLVLRYRVEETDDGLSGEEGTFTICSFWLVSALVEIGEIHRAKHLCERLLSFASPLHLYAEEIEPRTGRHLGNFPQAFTHLALINAVVHVIRAEDEADSSGVFVPANAPM